MRSGGIHTDSIDGDLFFLVVFLSVYLGCSICFRLFVTMCRRGINSFAFYLWSLLVRADFLLGHLWRRERNVATEARPLCGIAGASASHFPSEARDEKARGCIAEEAGCRNQLH